MDSPSIDALGDEPVFSYSNPLKEMKAQEEAKKEEKEVEAVEVQPVEEVPVEEVPAEEVEDKNKWIEEQKVIQSQLKDIKVKEVKQKKKLTKMFKIGFKHYKAGKLLRAIKIWRKVLKLDPEHGKARKGIKLAMKKYKIRKKKIAKKKLEMKRKAAVAAEMEIPEIAEGEVVPQKAEVAGTGPDEMEIPEVEYQPDLEGVAEGEIVTTEEPEILPEVVPEIVEEPPAPEMPIEEEQLPVEEPPKLIEEEISTPVKTEIIDEVKEKIPEPTISITDEEAREVLAEGPEDEFEEPIEAVTELPAEITPTKEILVGEPPEKTLEDLEKEFYSRAERHAKNGRFKDAVGEIEEVLNINPKNSLAWNDKGILLWTMGMRNEALDCYNEAVKFKPDFTDALINQGVALNNLNRRDEALVAYNKALEIDTNSEEALTNKGVVLFKMGKYQEAIDSFNRSININKISEEAWLNLGLTYEKLERFSDALSAFEEVKKLNPYNKEAQMGISECQKYIKYELLKAWNL
jgi:tetratricopeptide (TPR) repeat protein